MSASALGHVEVSAFLDVCSPASTVEHNVATSAQGVSSSAFSTSHLSPEHASSVSTCFPTAGSPSGFVLARVLDEDRCVELRWLSLVRREDRGDEMTVDRAQGTGSYDWLDGQAAVPPVRYTFADPILPDVYVTEANGTLLVHALSSVGILYRLAFSGPRFFAVDEPDEGYSVEFSIRALAGRTPTALHGVDADTVIVTCNDGSMLLLQWEPSRKGADAWRTTELKAASGYLSLISSRFSTRNIASLANETSTQSPLAIVSLVGGSHGPYNHSYSLSRDGKLRVWEHANGTCLRELQLGAVSAASQPGKLLRAVHVDSDPDYGAYLVALTGAEFRLYGVPRGSKRAQDLRQIGKQACPPAYRPEDLRDMQLVPLDVDARADEAGDRWTLWTLWERTDGEPALAYIPLARAGEAEPTWRYVNAVDQPAWSADYFDDLLATDTALSVNDVFLRHIFAPGHYAASTIRRALDDYIETVVSGLAHDAPHPAALMKGDEYDSLPEQVVDVVGCTLSLEVSSETGQYMHAVFESRLRTEWLRFVSLCNEGRAAARYPLSLAVDIPRKLVMAFTRDGVVTPAARDLHQVLSGEPAEIEAIPEDALATTPSIAPLQTRQVLVVLLQVARQLAISVKPEILLAFEANVEAVFRTMRRKTWEDIAVELFENVEDHVDEEVFESLATTLLEILPHLPVLWPILFPPVEPYEGAADALATDFALALTTSTTALAIESRYTLSVHLLLLSCYIAADVEVYTPAIGDLLPRTFAVVHGLATLRHMARTSAPSYDPLPSSAGEDESVSLTSRLGHLAVNGAEEAVPHAPTLSLLGAAARGLRRQPSAPFVSPSSASSPLALTAATAELIRGLDILNPVKADGPATLCEDLVYVDAARALEMLDRYPPDDHGMQFARGCATLNLGRYADAQHAFSLAAGGLQPVGDLPASASLLGVLSDPDWARSSEALFMYYRYIADFFSNDSAAAQVALFARLALEARSAAPLQQVPEIDVDRFTRELWQQLFDAELALHDFDQAYATLAAGIPYPDTQETCLRSLVLTMCEANEVDKLLRFPFVGLQDQVATHLEYRARHARFGSVPDYHQVAYAYFMSRNDYRSAARIMLQRIRQLDSRTSLERVPFHDAARERCRSYLAAINALYLVNKDDAWLAIASSPADAMAINKRHQADEAALPPGPKRRRLASGKHVVVDHIPVEEHGEAFAGHVDIVTLDMLREEYTLALAKLSLASSFSELARAGTDIDMDPEGVVTLYVQTGALTKAFAVAQTLDADMTPLFENLASRCVQLSRSASTYGSAVDTEWLNTLDEAAGLESVPALRGWQILRLYLERYDKPDARYRTAVLKRALADDRTVRPPQWLLSRLLEMDADGVLRAYIAHDRLEDALQVALSLVGKALHTLSRTPSPRNFLLRLPYALFDRLLGVSLSEGDKAEVTARSLQSQLREALMGLLPKMTRASEGLLAQHRKALAKARAD